VGFAVQRILPADLELMSQMLDVFATAFGDAEAYSSKRPSADYLARLLATDTFVALVAVEDGSVVGGLAAYELVKFEQERSEFYIYDLAVLEEKRRTGIATQLIAALKPIAAMRGAKVIFVQADYGDDAAVALYTKLGVREDVLHFDIATAM
jgi:aminoglycoside 3-N-acetyltransferase I